MSETFIFAPVNSLKGWCVKYITHLVLISIKLLLANLWTQIQGPETWTAVKPARSVLLHLRISVCIVILWHQKDSILIYGQELMQP